MPFKPKVKVSKPKVRVTKPKVRVSLVKCGRCGKTYSNPLAHTCVITTRRAAVPKKKGKR